MTPLVHAERARIVRLIARPRLACVGGLLVVGGLLAIGCESEIVADPDAGPDAPALDGGARDAMVCRADGEACTADDECCAAECAPTGVCGVVPDGGATDGGPLDGGTPEGGRLDGGHDAGPTCVDACSGEPRCVGDDVTTCSDHDGDGCVELGVTEHCASRCDDAACVECVVDDDCADPIREKCSAGACVARDQWSVTTIAYAGATTVHLDEIRFADATYEAAGGSVLLRFQQGDGWTIWSLNLRADTIVGPQPITGVTGNAYVTLSESDASVPAAYHGGYGSVGGTMTLSRADLYPGGVVAGTLSASLQQLPGSGSQTATLTAEFYAEIP